MKSFFSFTSLYVLYVTGECTQNVLGHTVLPSVAWANIDCCTNALQLRQLDVKTNRANILNAGIFIKQKCVPIHGSNMIIARSWSHDRDYQNDLSLEARAV